MHTFDYVCIVRNLAMWPTPDPNSNIVVGARASEYVARPVLKSWWKIVDGAVYPLPHPSLYKFLKTSWDLPAYGARSSSLGLPLANKR